MGTNLSILPVIPILIITLLTLNTINKKIGVVPKNQKYPALDGLRGYMAFSVFIHHGAYYYIYYKTGTLPNSYNNIFDQLGQISVFVFFMITGFLFFSIMLEKKNHDMDWKKYFLSRFFRIYPLFIFLMGIVIIVLGIENNWTIIPPISQRLNELAHWLFFNQVPINGFIETYFLTNKVLWSLVSEFLFYALLPFIGVIFLGIRASFGELLFSGLVIFSFIFMNTIVSLKITFLINSPFLIGILAALLYNNEKLRSIAIKNYTSIIILPLIFISYNYYNTINAVIPYACISISFILISLGNTMFGILTNYNSILLGQISYGLYLLHGVIFRIIFKHLAIDQYIIKDPQYIFWIALTIISIILTIVCTTCYRLIEKPFIELAPRISRRVFRHKSKRTSHTYPYNSAKHK